MASQGRIDPAKGCIQIPIFKYLCLPRALTQSTIDNVRHLTTERAPVGAKTLPKCCREPTGRWFDFDVRPGDAITLTYSSPTQPLYKTVSILLLEWPIITTMAPFQLGRRNALEEPDLNTTFGNLTFLLLGIYGCVSSFKVFSTESSFRWEYFTTFGVEYAVFLGRLPFRWPLVSRHHLPLFYISGH